MTGAAKPSAPNGGDEGHDLWTSGCGYTDIKEDYGERYME